MESNLNDLYRLIPFNDMFINFNLAKSSVNKIGPNGFAEIIYRRYFILAVSKGIQNADKFIQENKHIQDMVNNSGESTGSKASKYYGLISLCDFVFK